MSFNWRMHWQPCLTALICLCTQAFAEADWLRYQHTLLQDGELWRLLTANFIHIGWPHWTLNMAALLLIYALVGHHYSQWQWLLITVLSSLGVSIGLLLLNPGLHWYVGFSGASYGLLMAGAVADLADPRWRERLFGIVLLIFMTVKLIWEQNYGPVPGTSEMAGAPVVVDSHLYGAVAGALSGFGITLFKRWRALSPPAF